MNRHFLEPELTSKPAKISLKTYGEIFEAFALELGLSNEVELKYGKRYSVGNRYPYNKSDSENET